MRSAINSNVNCLEIVYTLYNATLVRLKQTDIDQEVKERAISCMYFVLFFLISLILY